MRFNEVRAIINKLIKEAKRQPQGLNGVGSCLCPSNPKYFREGYIKALKDLKIQLKIMECE